LGKTFSRWRLAFCAKPSLNNDTDFSSPVKGSLLVVDKEKTDLNLDTKVLSEFIYALNIARRQILSYPPGHPVINAAAVKLLDLLPQMFEFRHDITIGVARDTLLVGNQALDNTNPIYRDFAKNLFDAKVASLTINKDVTAAEICKFFELMRYKPEDLADRGGLHRVLTLSDIKGL